LLCTMTDKVLKFLSFSLLLLSSITAGADTKPIDGVWANSPLGKCYSSLDQYLISTYGPDYKNDENIQTDDVLENSHKYKWVRDITPGINITRVMFELRKDQHACATLFIPFASTVRGIGIEKATGLPAKFLALDSPPPGFPATEILYQFDAKTSTYFPKHCLKRFLTGKKQKVNCASVFR